MKLLGPALKMMELSSMMHLILASALRTSAGKGSPGVQGGGHVLLNCMSDETVLLIDIAGTLAILKSPAVFFVIRLNPFYVDSGV
jgi:hypothetical protein